MAKVQVRRTLKRDSGGYIDETAMAEVVRELLQKFPRNRATYAELREQVPKVVRLTRRDLRKSRTRRGERVWEQILRNLGAHIEYHEEFVKIPEGIRLRKPGKAKQEVAA